MSEEIVFAEAKEIKIGKYLLIDKEPYKVSKIDMSAPGKHGHAKLSITASAMFKNTKKIISLPSDATIEIPIITRKNAQIISVNGDSVQIMDMETYEMSDLEIPDEFKNEVGEGKIAELICAMGRSQIVKIIEGWV